MFYRLTLRGNVAPQSVVTRLHAMAQPASGLLWNWRHLFTWDGRRPPEFAGRVSDTFVKLQYLSPMPGISARPLIDGEIVPEGSGTQLRLRLRAIALDWLMLLIVTVTIFRAVQEEGLTVEVVVGSPLLVLSVGRGGSRESAESEPFLPGYLSEPNQPLQPPSGGLSAGLADM